MAVYVVALRHKVPSKEISLVDLVRSVPGVETTGTTTDRRICVEASPQAADELQKQHGNMLIVEPEIMHSSMEG